MAKSMMAPALLGAAAGAGVALLAYGVIRVAVDAQVTATLEREVPPLIRTELDAKLASFGLTPAVGASIAQAVGYLDRTGVFNALATVGV